MPTLTIFAAAPESATTHGTSTAGHLFYTISNGVDPTISAGFAPITQGQSGQAGSSATAENAPGKLYYDDNQTYINPSSLTLTITDAQYQTLRDFAENPSAFGFNTNYEVLSNSCVNFVFKGLEIAGIIPDGTPPDKVPINNIDYLTQLTDPLTINIQLGLDTTFVTVTPYSNSPSYQYLSGDFKSPPAGMSSLAWASLLNASADAAASNQRQIGDSGNGDVLPYGGMGGTGYGNTGTNPNSGFGTGGDGNNSVGNPLGGTADPGVSAGDPGNGNGPYPGSSTTPDGGVAQTGPQTSTNNNSYGPYSGGDSSPTYNGTPSEANSGGTADTSTSTTETSSPSSSYNPYNSSNESYSPPILLDLSGHGINITELNRSNTFMDTTGSGLSHRTAWAGAGTAVLFYDPNNLNAIVDKNQYVFTQWDPTATSDMQALRDVFDSNGDGVLNASDAKFNQFKLMVTNADGTTSVETLAQAGIASINLKADTTDIQYTDGSAITGETTFTYSNGTTGTVATTTLATDAQGHKLVQTTSVSGATTTITSMGYNSDGSIAFNDVQATVINGNVSTRTTTYDDNGDGVIDRSQVITTTTNADGSTVQDWLSYNGGGIKLSEVKTTTNATGSTVTIQRDNTGGGWFDQSETHTTAANGTLTVTLTNLNQDGSEISQTATAYSVDGLTKTVSTNYDSTLTSGGTPTANRITTDTLVNNADGSRNESVTTTSQNLTALGKVATATSANGQNVTVSADHTGTGVFDSVTKTAITMNADGTSTSTIQNFSQNNSYIDGETVTKSADGLSTTTVADLTGLHNADRTTADLVTLNADGSRDENVTVTSASGVMLGQTKTHLGADQVSKTVYVDAYGIGVASETETVMVNATTGVKTDTISNLAPSAALLNQSVTTTSADGLTKTTTQDVNGDGIVDFTTSDVTVMNADGSATETVSNLNRNGTLLDQTITTTSANGLTVTTSTNLDGEIDQTHKDLKVNNADGSVTETITDNSNNTNLLDQSVTQTSIDRRTVTTTDYSVVTNVSDVNVAYVAAIESTTTATNGVVTDLVTNYADNGVSGGLGTIINRSEAVISANGLSTTTYVDETGHGTSWDYSTAQNTTYNANGSIATTSIRKSSGGTVLGETQIVTSGNGLTSTVSKDFTGTGGGATFNQITTTNKTLNADGSATTTVSVKNQNSVAESNETILVSANGLSNTVRHDDNADGTIDQSSTDLTTYNANGSATEVHTDFTGNTNGTVRDVITSQTNILVAGIGRESITTDQSNGSVSYYSVETQAPLATGEVDTTQQIYSSNGGALLYQTKQAVSGNGLNVTNYTDVNGDGVWDYLTTDAKVINDDGSTTTTASLNNANGLVSEMVTTVSGNGLSTTVSTDANGATSSGAAVFNRVVTDNTVINTDGSHVETVTTKNQLGNATAQTQITISPDKRIKTTNRYLNETGSITHLDQSDVAQTNFDGSVTETVNSWAVNAALLSTIIYTTSANGLAGTTTYKNGSSTITDAQTSTTTINANGSTTTIFTDSDTVVAGSVLATSLSTLTSGNGLSSTVTLGLTGALATSMATSYATVETAATTYAATGIKTTTIADTTNGTASDTETITVSANGLTTSTSLKQQGAASAFYQDQFVINLDGSTTETETFHNPSSLTTILEQSTINVSWDGHREVTTTLTDYDAPATQVITINHIVDTNPATTVTPSFATTYNTVTDTFTRNADGTTKDQRGGTGAFGTGAYSQTTIWATNADASQTLATANYDSNGFVLGRTTRTTSANDLSVGLAIDYTGLDTAQNLASAAANLAAGSTVSGVLASDTIASQTTVLNADGSLATTTQFQLANSGGSILLEKSVTTLSANGLVTTTQVDNDGNGLFERTEVKTINPDGSVADVVTYYGNTSSNNSTIGGTNTYTTSANGLIKTLTTSTGIADTTVDFAEGNGSYQWSRVVTAGSGAASYGYKNSWATHYIDANGMDTWTDFDGIANATTSLVIDGQLESQYEATANKIAQTILGHGLDNAQQEYVSHFITNGVLDREQLAYWLVTSKEYQNNFQVKYTSGGATSYTASVIPFFENVLGRLPNAEELAVAAHYMPIHNPTDSQPNYAALAQAAVAVAEYAAEYELTNSKFFADTNVSLLLSTSTLNPTAPSWLAKGSSAVQLQSAGIFSYNNNYIIDLNAGSNASVAITVNGSGNIIIAPGLSYGTITVNGVNNTVEVNSSGTIVASSSEIMVDGGAVTVTGSYNQIVAAAGTTITDSGNYNTLSAATGSTINLGASSIDTINGAGLTINLANGDSITASNDIVNVATAATETVTGSGNTLSLSNGDTVTASNDIVMMSVGGVAGSASVSGNAITVNAGSTSATVNGTGNAVTGNAGGIVNYATNTIGAVIGSGLILNLQDGDAVTATNDTINVVASATVTLIGNGDTLNILNADNVTASNDTINVVASATVTLTGNGDTLNILNADNVTASNDTINVVAGATATLTGNGDTLNLSSGDSVTASNDTININIGGVAGSASVSFNTTTITAGASSAVVTGSGNAVSGAAGTVVNYGQLVTGTVLGNGLIINLTNGDDVTASNDTINLNGNAIVSVTGGGNTINLTNGSNLTASNDIVNVAASSSVSLNGSGNSVNVSGSTSVIDFGSSNTFNVAANSSLSLNGSGETVNLTNGDSLSGAGSSSITVVNGATVSVGGWFDTLSVGSNDSVTLSGSADTVQYGTVTGNDALSGFSGLDTIQFSHLSFANWTSFQAHMAQAGADTVITLDASDTVTLKGVTASSLNAFEFRFA